MDLIYSVMRATAPDWSVVPAANVDQFRPEGKGHCPQCEARVVWDDRTLRGRFDIRDQYVRSVCEGYNAPVWRDSCVEFFVQPTAGGYFNFEFNAGGHLLASYVRDPTRVAGGLKDSTLLPEASLRRVAVKSSLPSRVNPEIADPIAWHLEFELPLDILEPFCGPLVIQPGDRLRGNFYKCGDETSHPHWASWSPVSARNFHLPGCFGTLVFEA